MIADESGRTYVAETAARPLVWDDKCGHTCPHCQTGCVRPRYVIHGVHRCALGHQHDPTEDTPDACQVVFTSAALLARFDAWLTSQGLDRSRMPSRPDDLPTFTITIPEENRRA